MQDQLIKLGLSSGESKVYLSLLSLGLSTSGIIARNVLVSSSKIYEILDRLALKGLVSVIHKNNIKYFQAVEPERLNDYIHDLKKELDEKQEIVENIIPTLKNLSTISPSIRAEVFFGVKGVKSSYERLF
ncbi:MAG: hypothetical protein HeimC3_07020 [Candidatus Heimdallarchaeota archaeon LC_3]|nr:MAG: hypothetical protein HeimC3_07020 [Candidatus Heimdallarchaeota archaeon LC_3]